MKGEKVFLRILEKDDIPRTQKWIIDPEISAIMGYLPVFSLSHQLDWYDKISKAGDRYIFAICLNETNEHIGNIGLGNINWVHRHAMFNIFFAEKSNHSKGLGTEASRLILDFAFDRLNLNKVYLQTSEKFVAANKMYQKLGFSQDGILREHYYIDGKYEDKIIYSILKSEFKGI